ncbi:MAG TPA: gluconate 2-dehydrogenase subunit 3 family protein [Blastocatellia bacterium]|nr:gluconate 2-dehydrogenase subunit 3 family protein [Blastocatellia bacterium]
MRYGRKPDPVDVVIVGTGATGGTVAKVLCEAGLRVVGLERGPWLRPAEHFSGDELKFIDRHYLDGDAIPKTLRENVTSPTQLSFSFGPQMVGAGTAHWSGWFPRPMPSDFMQRMLHGDVAEASLADWPIRYADLEPYLTKVEWEFGCTGLPEANKFEPPRSRGYPSPPLPPTAFGKKFYEGCAKLGINAFPIPQAMVSTPVKGRDPSNWTGFWNWYGDPTTTRSSTLTNFVPEALATGNFDLRPHCYVREVTMGKDGRAKGVVYFDPSGHEVEQEAQIVVLCLGAIESSRLLLLSSTASSPQGLANSSGMVGKNATFHGYLFAVGLFDKEIHQPLYGFSGNYVSGGSFEFYETDAGRGHIAGSIIAASGVGHPIGWDFPGRPLWGSAMKDADRDFYNYAMKIGMVLHDLPVESNRVDLDPDVSDSWGLPLARITHKSHPNDVNLAKWQIDKNMEILDAAGASKTIPVYIGRFPLTNSRHQHGTLRMGTDPSRSVLNEWCQAHDVENLFVLDGSCFPTATGVNPTLTMMANAWRCCEYIANVYAKSRSERLPAPPGPQLTHRSVVISGITSQANWTVRKLATDSGSNEPLYFTGHEWATIAAATARMMPIDHDPGSNEAGVVRFIDRYLSGLDFIFAAADGSGFLQLEGEAARAWRRRISIMQQTYREGIRKLDEISKMRFGTRFRDLEADNQDRALEVLSGAPKPERVRLKNTQQRVIAQDAATVGGDGTSSSGGSGASSDEGTDFFLALAIHTRQGFYSDPIYGGNQGGIGWRVIGFPGPKSLADTQNLSFSVKQYLVLDYDWSSLIPFLKDPE